MTSKVFVAGRSQAVRIPKAIRFDTNEVYIERRGNQIILTPKPKSWEQYLAEGERFSADFPGTIADPLSQVQRTLE